MDLKNLLRRMALSAALIVEASPILEDNQWWLDLAAEDPFFFGVIGRLDPASDDFEKNLRRFAKNSMYCGIRISHSELKAGLKGKIDRDPSAYRGDYLGFPIVFRETILDNQV